MKIAFFDEQQRPSFKGGKLIICKPDQMESREWATNQFSFFPKHGETVTEIPLGDTGECDDRVFNLAPPGSLIIVKDWAGKDHLSMRVAE